MKQLTDKPIVLDAESVRAILDGRKTQHRVIVKPQPVRDETAWACYFDRPNRNGQYGPPAWGIDETPGEDMLLFCPFGGPGDRLYVKETWGLPRKLLLQMSQDEATERRRGMVRYRADGCDPGSLRWSQANHMPRWAARIWLEICDVRVQQLGDMKPADIVAEGFPFSSDLDYFKSLWKKRYGAWNPEAWCWALTFKRLEAVT